MHLEVGSGLARWDKGGRCPILGEPAECVERFKAKQRLPTGNVPCSVWAKLRKVMITVAKHTKLTKIRTNRS